MALKHDKPNAALMRELELVANDALALLGALRESNFLPDDFPIDEIDSLVMTLNALPNGTAEGCRIPLDYSRLRLAEIGQQQIVPEDVDNTQRSPDAPALARGMTIDRAFGDLIRQISYALAEYRRQADEIDEEDETDRPVQPSPSLSSDLASVRQQATEIETDFQRTGETLKRTTKSDAMLADQLRRQVHDVEGHARLAKSELQQRAIRPIRLKRITAALQRLPSVIQNTGNAIVISVDVAEPFIKQWSSLWVKLEDIALKNLREFGENLQRAGRRLKPAEKPNSDSAVPSRLVFRDVDESWCPEMVWLPSGTFLIGSPETEWDRAEGEGPQHEAAISRPFALGRYAITFTQYDHFCVETDRKKPDDSGWGRGQHPVIHVSHDDALAYCAWLGEITGHSYRLPTEAEWEFACRAGTATPFSFGSNLSSDQANYNGNRPYAGAGKGEYRGQTMNVGSLPANSWGLHEMHGNVREWCADGYRSYESATVTDPQGPYTSTERVVRGGSWFDPARQVRSADRGTENPELQVNVIGFRCARAQS